jgi:hypothetical protein
MAGAVGGAAADLELTSAGLTRGDDEDAALEGPDPAAPLSHSVTAAVGSCDVGPAQASGKAQKKERPIAQAARAANTNGALQRMQSL